MEEHIDKIESFISFIPKLNNINKPNIININKQNKIIIKDNSNNINNLNNINNSNNIKDNKDVKQNNIVKPRININFVPEFKNKEYVPNTQNQKYNSTTTNRIENKINDNTNTIINKTNNVIVKEKVKKIIGNNIILDDNTDNNKIIEASQKYVVKPNNEFKIDAKDKTIYNKTDKDDTQNFIINMNIINNNLILNTKNIMNPKIKNIFNFYKQELKPKINNVEINIHINYFPKKILFDLLNNSNDNINYEIYYNSLLIFKIKSIDTIIEPTILDFNLYLYSYINNINTFYSSNNINRFITDYSRINFNKNSNNIVNFHFENIFMIHLEKDIERLKNILILYEKNISFFLVDAIGYNEHIDIYNFSLYCVYRNFYEEHLYEINKYNSVTKGSICLNLTNQLILNYCLNKKINKLLIFEDDILIHKNYINLLNITLENINEYNLLWLGSKQGKEKLVSYNNYLNIPNNDTWGTHSYVINNCVNLVKQSFETCNMPIDCLLTQDKTLNLLKKYVVDNNIFITILEENSSIQNNNETYKLWNWNTNNYITELEKDYSIFLSLSNSNYNLENPWDNIRYYFSLIFKSTKTVNNNKIFFDFIDREFGWDWWKWDKPNYENEHTPSSYEIFPIEKKWCGIIHHPYKLNKKVWEDNLCVSEYLDLEIWKKSIKNCSQLFVLSSYLKNKIMNSPNIISLNNIKISVIKHPTWLYKNISKFDFNKFLNNQNKKITMIGWSYRKFTSIYLINTPIKKAWIGTNNNRSLNLLHREMIDMKISISLNDVELIKQLTEEEYNEYLTQNIVFLDFDCASANNAVIECISRNTPIIVRKHPAVIEYLGTNYPLYFEKLDDVNELCNLDKIKKASIYLSNLNKYNLNFTKFFIDLYQTLN